MDRAVLYQARLIKQFNLMKTAGRKQGRPLNAIGLTERLNGIETTDVNSRQRERQTETQRQTDRQTQRRERGRGGCSSVCIKQG